MSLSASRAVLRQSHSALRRTAVRKASSTSEAASAGASKAKETASEATSKASEGLSRVKSSADSGISKASQGMSSTMGRIGGRTGRMIGFVESMIPPTIYYSRVGLELSKLIFQGQKMSPPSVATFQSYFQPLVNVVRHPMSVFTHTTTSTNTMSPEHILSQIRSLNRESMVTVGVVFAEVLGFFTVGEMLGRFKLVGYRGEVGEHH
ncbi:MAG: hypothetical protein M1827_001290 [Pycnora praestabilis]|nr:MAG: hypothetical protein M1827_001290 [Pycnora praestabilis]